MLKLENLKCGYGAFTAVHGLSLKIPQGQIFALVGANGAGKTSTIMTIAGQVELQGGSISFDGRDISKLPASRRVTEGIALAPEGRRLFADMSVEENLTMGGYSRPRSAEAEAKAMVLETFPRLKERIAQRAGSLSGGEQQMLAIGRALMADPKFLMIDEVSLGLMPKIVDVCYDAIEKLKARGITILLVEQNTQRALAVADQVCVLESGRSVWMGSAEEARKDPKLIEAYLGLTN
ncbi:ABC transporter ATP-binding protein [Denitrobaculum tricleocarpae]|uniref:ABC transporter ATP-binding protein n=1 Tax=Denitrobaculum tricleocarpae TaxID=2591009 RepID=A0A545TKK8_9PROT|nr:ABC transporter ATP-binding protein [Denitrobaculum tricleocarpae]TQV77762.1 ABC transporter ATP-binding protein [Denitrobaculum tricleocarpae]